MTDTAELIERLREGRSHEVFEARFDIATALETLQAENERLEAALSQIADHENKKCGDPRMAIIARAALEAALPDAP